MRVRAAMLVVLAAAPLAAQSPPPWLGHEDAAMRAYRTRDFVTARTQWLAEERLIGPNPRVIRDLAVVAMRLGTPRDALHWLDRYAATGLSLDVASDSAFAAIRGTPAFDSIRARMASNAAPVVRGETAFTLSDPDLIAEDLAYDPVGRRFYVTSVHRRTITAIDTSGRASRFAGPGGGIGENTPATDSVWGMFAVSVDTSRRVLWATTAAIAVAEGYQPADSGRSALLEYDLGSGRLLRRLELPRGTGAHLFGDMTVAADGTVYVSDGISGIVYALSPGGRALEPLVAPGTFVSPQTPAVSPDGRRLFVADYERGIGVIDLATHTVTWVTQPATIVLDGTDGLYLDGQDLIAVQNGVTPNRVLRLRLDSGMRRVERSEIVEGGTPPLRDPTHGVIVGRDFYFIANSGWSRVAPDGAVAPGAAADAPAIRRVSLDRYGATRTTP